MDFKHNFENREIFYFLAPPPFFFEGFPNGHFVLFGQNAYYEIDIYKWQKCIKQNCTFLTMAMLTGYLSPDTRFTIYIHVNLTWA